MKVAIAILLVLILGVGFLMLSEPDTSQADAMLRSVSGQGVEIPKGERVLGVSATEGDIGFDASYNIAQRLGSTLITLPLPWDELETEHGELESSWLGIANTFYGSQEVSVSLEINPIDTNVLRVPEQYRDAPMSGSSTVAAFERVLRFAASQVSDLDVTHVVIGNEVDGYLSEETISWTEYRNFFKQVAPLARELFPNAKVGVKTTFSGALTVDGKQIHEVSDAVFVTHYLLSDDGDSFGVVAPARITEDFAKITQAYAERDISFLELGYPSSELVGSSEQLQLEFYENFFLAWDEHAKQVTVVNLLGVTDFPATQVAGYTEYYSFADEAFVGYIGSLGLLTADGQPKDAFKLVAREAKRRGF